MGFMYGIKMKESKKSMDKLNISSLAPLSPDWLLIGSMVCSDTHMPWAMAALAVSLATADANRKRTLCCYRFLKYRNAMLGWGSCTCNQ